MTGRAHHVEAPAERLDAVGDPAKARPPVGVRAADAVVLDLDPCVSDEASTRTTTRDASAYFAQFVIASAMT